MRPTLPLIVPTESHGIAMTTGGLASIDDSVDGCHSQWFIERGRLVYNRGAERGEADRGTMVWRLPYSGLEPVWASGDLQVTSIEFTTTQLCLAFGGELPLPLIEQARHNPVFAAPESCASRLKLLHDTVEQTGHTYYNTRVGAALALLESELLDSREVAQPEMGILERRHFGRFERMVANRVKEQHNVAFYAGELCLTPQYLSQVVRRVTGAGALAFINERLADAIAEMLDMTDLTVQQIADATGFADQASLSKFFKRLRGMAPSAWRQRGRLFD